MDKQQPATGKDPEQLVEIMGDIAQRSRSIVEEFVNRQAANDSGPPRADIGQMGSAFIELTTRMMSNPTEMMRAQFGLWQDYMRLWQATAQRMMGQQPEPVISPERGDRRFRDPAWNDNLLFDFIKQSYLLSARYVLDSAGNGDGLDDKTQQKVEFYSRQFVDALAPSNFVVTNPEVLRATVESRGENLLKGLQNMLGDLEAGKGQLKISMTDMDAFEVGKNIATTPGKIVYQNDLMQLVQYTPSTETAHKRPLMIVPPWINKFYILDLQPKNSFIRYAVDQGFTVFVLSWVNPDEELSHKTFEDYMLEGPLEALDAIEKATGEKDVTAIGYCLGGTLLAATLAYMAVKKDNRIKAATFFTTMVDFADPGELGVFIDEEQLAGIEEMMAKRGYLDGSEMATTFNMLRANDLIWSFVVNNYLLGKDPFPLRSTLLEQRLHSDAGGHARLLSASLLSREQTRRAGRHRALRCAHRSAQGPHPGLLGVDQGRPHRTVEEHLFGDTALQGSKTLRARRLGPHRRRDQPARSRQIRLLDQRRPSGGCGQLAGDRAKERRQLVGRLVGVEQGQVPEARSSQTTGRWRARDPGRRSGQLCRRQGRLSTPAEQRR